jgi:hypothetical protein
MITQAISRQKLRFSSLHNNNIIGRITHPSVPFPSFSHFDTTVPSANLFLCEVDPLDLSIDQILFAAAGMKEDLQRQANRYILRNDMPRALGALCSIETVDNFVYLLKVRSGSQLGLPKVRGRRMKAPKVGE